MLGICAMGWGFVWDVVGVSGCSESRRMAGELAGGGREGGGR